MMNLIKGFIKEEDAMGTVEIVLIIAVLVGLTVLFRNYIGAFVKGVLDKILKDDIVKDPLDQPTPSL